MTTLLVANRGEIAVRVFRTAKRMGMRTVAVFSDADAEAPHVRAADACVRIGPPPAAESYLRIEAIVDAAKQSGATLVHPGYGFLAEDDAFAEACEDAGLIFVGPPSSVLKIVGDKVSARALAEAAGVPVFPGYAGEDASDAALTEAAHDIGFPVLVKPAAGGGGKGMELVRDAAELADALASARRIALAAFGDNRLLLERYVPSPRHVEVQVLADAHGTVVHLGERDCSLQRRHQKVLEESPAPNLDESLRTTLHESAVAFARRAAYVGAGTCEFLVSSDGSAGFIEMNARLQVEHPVTEMVTGLDLVELQLRVALGEALPAFDARPRGHAIEVRVYAEDPRNGFVPQAGRIEHVRWPASARVDTGIEPGTDVPAHYDPLLAKVIVHGEDRDDALRVLDVAVGDIEILGVRTNVPFLAGVLRDDVVRHGRITTDWLETTRADRFVHDGTTSDAAFAIAAAAEAHRIAAARSRDPFATLGAWRGGGRTASRIVLRVQDDERAVAVDENADTHAAVRVGDAWLVWADGDQHEILVGPRPRRASAGPARLDSPLPGQVVAVRVHAGQVVEAGEELVVVEAMKMEHSIKAPAAGTVRAVLCAAGDQVDRGQPLVDFDATD
jgi:acetyl/propionyl-CoA carboxylase alpha subunit